MTEPVPAPFIPAADLRKWLPSAATEATISNTTLETLGNEYAARVRRVTGLDVLPGGDEEIEGIVRDFVVARVYTRLFAGPNRGEVPIARELREDAQARLEELDLGSAVEGEDIGGGEGSGMDRPVTSADRAVANLDPGPLWDWSSVVDGYRSPGFHRGP